MILPEMPYYEISFREISSAPITLIDKEARRIAAKRQRQIRPGKGPFPHLLSHPALYLLLVFAAFRTLTIYITTTSWIC